MLYWCSKVIQHYEQDKFKYDQYKGIKSLKSLNQDINNNVQPLRKKSQENDATVHASYVLSEIKAKHSKQFIEGN